MIRNVIAAVLLLKAAEGAATPLVRVLPAGGFSASGELALKKGSIPVSCKTTFDGEVDRHGGITVTAVYFGGFNPLCKSIKALGLPWAGQVDNPGQLTVQDMQVKVRVPLLGGVCGPGPVTLEWTNDNAAATFSSVALGPDCAMDGTMLTTPPVNIQPRENP